MQRILHTTLLATFLFLGWQSASALDLTVTITSLPVVTGQVGVPYVYDVDAVSSDPTATLTYTLHGNTPSGMTINAGSGLIEWTPAFAGSFGIRVRVKARLNDTEEAEAEQEYSLVIGGSGGGATASLEGTVRNQAGAGVRLVEMKMFEGTGKRVLFRTRTDSTGAYRISGVIPGTYFVKADPSDMGPYEDQWFENVKRFEQATPVVIAESSIVVINFSLLPRDSDDIRYDVFGVVRGPNGAPLTQAKVTFMRRHRDDDTPLSRSGGDSHSHHGNHGNDVEVATTDSLGTYHLRLRGRGYTVSTLKSGYLRQYWDHKNTAAEADQLLLVKDTTGIDFDLAVAAIQTGGTSAGRVTGNSVELRQNYPNPFNPTTSISFSLPVAGRARLDVYNMLGQSVATLVDGELSAGAHQVEWRADGAASGLYFYRVEFGGTAQVRQMMLVR